MEILFIGNLNKNNSFNGQVAKTLLYHKIINERFGKTIDVDLFHYGKNVFKLFKELNRKIKQCEIVFTMPGPGSCRIVLWLIGLLNKKLNKRIVYCAIGTGFFSNLLRKKSPKYCKQFFEEYVFREKGSRLDKKILSRIDAAIFQTPLLVEAHKNYFDFNNCYLLENFRVISDRPSIKTEFNIDKPLRTIYVSRISEEKGIIELMKVIDRINKRSGIKMFLDIYGEMDTNKQDIDSEVFAGLLNENVKHCGALNNNEVIATISKYDLFVFPTKYVGEGTPGVISESLIAGVPVISSRFLQNKYILKDGFDSVLFDFNDYDDLERKLIDISKQRDVLAELTTNAYKSGDRFLFENNEKTFYYLVTGDKQYC